MRATDQDRDKAVEAIEDAYSKGQLNDAERNDLPAMSVYVSNDFHDTAYTSLTLSGKVIYTYRFK